jgi:hypothetical protein
LPEALTVVRTVVGSVHRQVLAPFDRKRATRNFGCAMMNAATLKQIAAVKPIVSKGSHVWT